MRPRRSHQPAVALLGPGPGSDSDEGAAADEGRGSTADTFFTGPAASGGADACVLTPDPGVYAESAGLKLLEEGRPCPFSPAEMDFLRLTENNHLHTRLWQAILKWHNAHVGSKVREDPRTYSANVAARYRAEDKHQHTASHEHTTPLALVPFTKVPFTDPVWLIQDILLDSSILGNMDLLPQLRSNTPYGPLNASEFALAPAEPSYSEACDGQWWIRTQQRAASNGEYLIAYVMYLDGTWVTSSGARKCKPLSITLANLPGAAFRKNSAKRIICQVPDFPCTKKDTGKAEAKAGHRAHYHSIIRQVSAWPIVILTKKRALCLGCVCF